MKKYTFLSGLFLLCFSGLYAQSSFPNVLVDNTTTDGECTIIVNPADPTKILAAANPDIIYRSSDGGQTWTRSNLSPFSSTSLIGDVALAADLSGNYYYQDLDGQLLFHTLKSTNFGANWGTETVFGDAGWVEDKNWLACDRVAGSPYQSRLYCAWTRRSNSPSDSGYIFLNHSSDGGQSWSVRETLDVVNPFPFAVPPIGTGLACGPGGSINVSWGGGIPNRIHFKKSTDGGVTWPAANTIVDYNVQPAGDYYDNISHPISFSAQFTSLACDASSGTYSGNLYCVWDDVRNGADNADIFLARSTDGGQTWNTQRINDDMTTRNQVVPTVAVDPTTGWVYVSYLDARLNTDSYDDSLHYYLAWSSDGGQTFQNAQVSQQVSTIPNIHSDYMGMDAYGGKVHLFWAGGQVTLQAWTAAITQQQLLSVGKDTEARPGLVLYPAVPNPSIDFTTLDFEISKPEDVSLIVTDLNGKQVAALIDGQKMEPGRHQQRIEHSVLGLSSGIYIATIRTASQQLSRKFTVAH